MLHSGRVPLWADLIVERTGCSIETAQALVPELLATRGTRKQREPLKLLSIEVGSSRTYPRDRMDSIHVMASKYKARRVALFEVSTLDEVFVRREPPPEEWTQ